MTWNMFLVEGKAPKCSFKWEPFLSKSSELITNHVICFTPSFTQLVVQLQSASKYTFKIPSVALSLILFQINFQQWVSEDSILDHKMFDQGTHVVVLNEFCLFYCVLTLALFSGYLSNLSVCFKWRKLLIIFNVFST